MQWSILVVGAGPTGLTAALELARRGLHARVIDAGAGPTPENESRALGILPRTLEILEASGVAVELRTAGNPVRRVEIRHDGRLLAQARFDDLPHPDPIILVLSQGRTERLLLAALGDRGIAVEWNTRLVALGRGTVIVEHGGREEAIAADHVVGCDGAHSQVRRLAGIGFESEAIDTEWGLADIELAEAQDPSTVSANFVRGGGAFGRIPLGPRMVRYVGTFRDLAALVREPVAAVGWTSQFRVSFRVAETFARGHILLAGDAAHVHSPVGARGMNLGIEDAAWAAWCLVEGREGTDYSAARLPVARRTLAETRSQTRVVLGATPTIRAARRYLPPLVLGVPPLRRRALVRMLGLDQPPLPWL